MTSSEERRLVQALEQIAEYMSGMKCTMEDVADNLMRIETCIREVALADL